MGGYCIPSLLTFGFVHSGLCESQLAAVFQALLNAERIEARSSFRM